MRDRVPYQRRRSLEARAPRRPRECRPPKWQTISLSLWGIAVDLFWGVVLAVVCLVVAFVLVIAASSAATNRRAEDVGVKPVVVSELKFRNVQRQVLGAHFVEGANNTALQNRPEAFNRVGVDRTNNGVLGVFALGVINDAVLVAIVKAVIGAIIVRAEQTNAIGHGFFDERFDRIAFNVFDDASNDIALALHSTDHDLFADAAPLIVLALIPMAVLVFAADIGFVDFDNAAKFDFRLNQSGADFVAHSPSGLIAAESHVAHDLEGAHSLFAGQHQVSDFEPVTERFVSILEDGPGNVGESIAGLRSAVIALPVKGIALERSYVKPAARALNAIGPPSPDQIGATSILIREHALEVGGTQLMDRLRSTGHDGYPLSVEGYCHA